MLTGDQYFQYFSFFLIIRWTWVHLVSPENSKDWTSSERHVTEVDVWLCWTGVISLLCCHLVTSFISDIISPWTWPHRRSFRLLFAVGLFPVVDLERPAHGLTTKADVYPLRFYFRVRATNLQICNCIVLILVPCRTFSWLFVHNFSVCCGKKEICPLFEVCCKRWSRTVFNLHYLPKSRNMQWPHYF